MVNNPICIGLLCLIMILCQACLDNASKHINVTNLNQFAIKLYQQTSSASNANENMALSPFGVSQVLETIYSVTSGNTHAEIGNPSII